MWFARFSKYTLNINYEPEVGFKFKKLFVVSAFSVVVLFYTVQSYFGVVYKTDDMLYSIFLYF